MKQQHSTDKATAQPDDVTKLGGTRSHHC